MRRTILLALATAVASVLTPALEATTTCTFTTVGATMTLDADCTTDFTILVPNGSTLDGSGKTITAQDPSGGPFAVVKNLTISTNLLANVCDAGADRARGGELEERSQPWANRLWPGLPPPGEYNRI